MITAPQTRTLPSDLLDHLEVLLNCVGKIRGHIVLITSDGSAVFEVLLDWSVNAAKEEAGVFDPAHFNPFLDELPDLRE